LVTIKGLFCYFYQCVFKNNEYPFI